MEVEDLKARIIAAEAKLDRLEALITSAHDKLEALSADRTLRLERKHK